MVVVLAVVRCVVHVDMIAVTLNFCSDVQDTYCVLLFLAEW